MLLAPSPNLTPCVQSAWSLLFSVGIFWQLLPLLRAPRGAPTSPLLAPSIPGGLSHDPYSKKPSCLYLCSSLQAEKPRGQPGHAVTPQPLVFTPMVTQAGCALRCAAVRGLLVDPRQKPRQPHQRAHTQLGVSPLWVSPGVTYCPCLSLLGLSLPSCLVLPCCVFLPSFAQA